MQEVMARHGQVLLISDAEGIAIAGQGVRAALPMPMGGGLFAPILYAVPMQYLAYHTAVAKGHRCRPTPQSGEVGDVWNRWGWALVMWA